MAGASSASQHLVTIGIAAPPISAMRRCLAIIDIEGKYPKKWVRRDVSLTGLASYGGDDPEPEFVDVNERNQAVVSLQENNHLDVVDLVNGAVTNHFDAGAVSLDGIDATEDWSGETWFLDLGRF